MKVPTTIEIHRWVRARLCVCARVCVIERVVFPWLCGGQESTKLIPWRASLIAVQTCIYLWHQNPRAQNCPSMLLRRKRPRLKRHRKEDTMDRVQQRPDGSIWSSQSRWNRSTGRASQNEIMYKTRWHVGVARFARALPVSVWVNTAVLLLLQLLRQGPWSPPCRAMTGWQAAVAHGQFQEV